MATNLDLIKKLQTPLKEQWGYVWGLNGSLYTQALANQYAKAKRTPPAGRDAVNYWIKDCAKWIGKMCADCSGIIVWAMRQLGTISSSEDISSAGFNNKFTQSGPISTIPEIPGLGVWKSGHIGIYEGNGYVLEERSTAAGMVRTKLKERDFTRWGKFHGIVYQAATTTTTTTTKTTSTTTTTTTAKARAAKCTGDNVNIRKTENGVIIGQISKDQPLIIYGTGDWLRCVTLVKDKTLDGYIYKQYVS